MGTTSAGVEVVVVGSINMDFVTVAPRLPRPGETVLGERFLMVPGGKGNNQAVTAARLGARTAFLGCIGRDQVGDLLVEALDAEGLDPSLLARVDHVPTGVAQVAVDAAGNNAITVVPLANHAMTPEHVEARGDLIAGARVLLCQLETPIETVRAALRLARAAGVRTVLNPAPAAPLDDELLALVDICVPNESEAAVLVGGEELHDVAGAARELLGRGCGAVVVTLGGDGALLVEPDREHRVEAFAVDVVDTVAAGDAFCGGLATALARGESMDDALDLASAAGAVAVTVAGATPSLPRAQQVAALLATRTTAAT